MYHLKALVDMRTSGSDQTWGPIQASGPPWAYTWHQEDLRALHHHTTVQEMRALGLKDGEASSSEHKRGPKKHANFPQAYFTIIYKINY